MLPGIIEFAKQARRKVRFHSGKVLEIGSYDINGSIRPAFPDAAEYIGIDIAQGPGVDRVLPADQIESIWGKHHFDTVICCEMLEHDRTPWVTIEQIHKVLKPGGFLFISTPTYGFPVHRHPKDYYRYGEDAFREVFFEGCAILKLATVTDGRGNPVICCLGQKQLSIDSEGTPAIKPAVSPLHSSTPREQAANSTAKESSKSQPQTRSVTSTASRPGISVILCSINDGNFKRVSRMYQNALKGEPFEIIRVRGTDSLASGFNRAASNSEGDLLLFSHDDIELLAPNVRQRIRGHMEYCDILGVAGTRYYAGGDWGQVGAPYLGGQVAFPLSEGKPPAPGYNILIFGVEAPRMDHMQAADGLFLAVRKDVFKKVQFDAKTFDGFHGYDVDFTYSAFRSGFRLSIATDLVPVHASAGNWDKAWRMYTSRFLDKHRATLGPSIARHYRFATVQVNTKKELLEVMLPQEYPLPGVFEHKAARAIEKS